MQNSETITRSPRLKVLVFLDYYLPGFRFGGITTAVASLVESLGDQIEFFLVTAPHDDGSDLVYPEVRVNQWNQIGKAQVMYTDGSLRRVRQAVRHAKPDVLYLNSFWSSWTVRVLWLRKLGLLPNLPVLLAPRGTFHPQALSIKPAKKRIYRALSDILRLSSDVRWHATSEQEKQDILQYRGPETEIVVAPDLSRATVATDLRSRKVAGRLRAVAISRLAAMKNFEFLIAALRDVRGEVELDLFGPLDDAAYWKLLQNEIAKLPGNIRVRCAGLVAKAEVASKLQEYDVHTLPSRGENFGYSIVEALGAGLPVVISDHTPWHGLEAAHAGFDLPLVQRQWTDCLQRLVDMDAVEHEQLRRGAVEFYRSRVIKPENVTASLEMFRAASTTTGQS